MKQLWDGLLWRIDTVNVLAIKTRENHMLIPSQPVPELQIDTLAHGKFNLDQDAGKNGTLVIFYRGLHCPICIRQLTEIEGALGEFAELGIEVIAISSDGMDRAAETAERAGVSKLRVGHSMDLKAARDDWGLLISSAREGSAEADFFAEPGHFYIAPDRTLYFGWTQTTPFARPAMSDIIGGLRFTLDKNYPPRGMYTGKLPGEA